MGKDQSVEKRERSLGNRKILDGKISRTQRKATCKSQIAAYSYVHANSVLQIDGNDQSCGILLLELGA
jgi:hypothetical protein